MSRVSFNKPALTYQEQVEQLSRRGLIIDNVERATHLLESISYYRLSGYWYPLLADKKAHIFKGGAHFDNAFEMYSFDRALRVMVIRELEKIEISIRSKMMYVLSHDYDPFWHADPKLFKSVPAYEKTLANLENEYSRSKEEFIVISKTNMIIHYHQAGFFLKSAPLELSLLCTITLFRVSRKDKLQTILDYTIPCYNLGCIV